MLKRDHYVLGLVVGILAPTLLFGLILLMNFLLFEIGVAKLHLDFQTHILVSLFGNLIAIRYYFVNLKFDKTGRGVLLITFILIIVFFAFKDIIVI